MTHTIVKLSTACKEAITLEGALAECKSVLTGAFAMLYGMDSCQIAQIAETSIVSYYKDDISRTIFEARIFCTTGELRWVADSDMFDPENSHQAKGTAVFLSESKTPEGWTVSDSCNLIPNPNQYLLWGKAANTAKEGWIKLYEDRIGNLVVPLQGNNENDRIKIDAIEYLGEDDEFGNMAVKAERLTGISWMNDSATKKEHGNVC